VGWVSEIENTLTLATRIPSPIRAGTTRMADGCPVRATSPRATTVRPSFMKLFQTPVVVTSNVI
jgi:hypothetical protein